MKLLTNTIVCAGLLVAVSLAGCTEAQEPGEDELAGESERDGDAIGKADGPESTFTYYTVRPDYRRCAFPLCGGFHLARVNRALTRCADGAWAESCYVSEIDWSALGMGDAQVQELRGAIERGALLLRGSLGTRDYGGSFGAMGVLAASVAWLGATDNPAAGVVTRVTDSGLRCVTTPCWNTLREAKLNSVLGADFSELWLEDTGLDRAAIDGAMAAIYDHGLLVAGYRYYWWDGGWQKGRYVTQLWQRVEARAESACVVGGCSSQVCSDEADGPVVTTCEWRPEYACYRTATCERQNNGRCGWTMDQELSDCLGNPPAP